MQDLEKESKNPWVDIWKNPRETMRSILNTNPYRWIIWLALISGLLTALTWIGYLWIQYPEKENYRQTLFLVSLIIVGCILSLFHLYFGSWLLQVVGNWLKGQGNYTQVKSAVGWANYPFIIVGILNLLGLATLKYPLLSFMISLVYLAFFVWAIVIYLNLLSEAHRFSIWRALATILIASAIIFLILLLISMLVPMMSPLFVKK